MIQLTEAARNEIDRLRSRQNQPDALLRVDLQPSSCAQWAYTLSLESAPSESDSCYELDGLTVLVSQDGDASLIEMRSQSIENLKIDFAEDLTGGAFRFDNPLATESCRCGCAFSIR